MADRPIVPLHLRSDEDLGAALRAMTGEIAGPRPSRWPAARTSPPWFARGSFARARPRPSTARLAANPAIVATGAGPLRGGRSSSPSWPCSPSPRWPAPPDSGCRASGSSSAARPRRPRHPRAPGRPWPAVRPGHLRLSAAGWASASRSASACSASERSSRSGSRRTRPSGRRLGLGGPRPQRPGRAGLAVVGPAALDRGAGCRPGPDRLPRRGRRRLVHEDPRRRDDRRTGPRRRSARVLGVRRPAFLLLRRSERAGQESRRWVGDVLLWADGPITYRLETSLGRDAAIAIAETLQIGGEALLRPVSGSRASVRGRRDGMSRSNGECPHVQVPAPLRHRRRRHRGRHRRFHRLRPGPAGRQRRGADPPDGVQHAGRQQRTGRRHRDRHEREQAPATTTDGSVAGHMDVAPNSVAGYRVREQLANLPAESDAVGRTDQVTGSITIERSGSTTTLTAGALTVDTTSITSDKSQRDNRMRDEGLQTDQFPTATFTLTKPVEIPAAALAGTASDVTLTGDLTLHGVTKSVRSRPRRSSSTARSRSRARSASRSRTTRSLPRTSAGSSSRSPTPARSSSWSTSRRADPRPLRAGSRPVRSQPPEPIGEPSRRGAAHRA